MREKTAATPVPTAGLLTNTPETMSEIYNLPLVGVYRFKSGLGNKDRSLPTSIRYAESKNSGLEGSMIELAESSAVSSVPGSDGIVANIVEENGFLVTGPLVGHEFCALLETTISKLEQDGVGTRNLIEHSWCVDLAKLIRAHQLIAPFLSAATVAVQCTLFEKSQNQNWLVPVHQDLSIEVKEKIAHPALAGWSEKEDSIFVQPPDSVLQEIVAIRFHIDECGLNDGPLGVVAGSHKTGRLTSQAALAERDRIGETLCPVERASAMLMKPLLLHASSKASGHSRRRVLHFVFAPPSLPFGLRWRHAF